MLYKNIIHCYKLRVTCFQPNHEVVIWCKGSLVQSVDSAHVSSCNKATELNALFVCVPEPCVLDFSSGKLIQINNPCLELRVTFQATYLNCMMSVPYTVDHTAVSECNLNNARNNNTRLVKVFVDLLYVIRCYVTLEDSPEVYIFPVNVVEVFFRTLACGIA